MKKKIFISFFLLLIVSFYNKIHSQDIIVKMNGDEIQSKILEVNPSEIKYKKFDNQDGPLFIIKRTEVFMIKYANGDKEVINQKAAQSTDTTHKSGNVTTVKVTYSSLGKNKDIPDYLGAIKVAPLLSLIGEFPVFFEYAIKPKSSFEVGLGPTFPNSFSGGILNSYINNLDNRSKKMGYSVALNYRIYPSVVFDEFYFGIEFRYRAFLAELKSCGSQTFQNKVETLAHTDAKIIIGYVSEMGSNALIDYYLGFGIRNYSYEYFYCDDTAVPSVLITKNEKEVLPTFTFGIKFGFGLENNSK